MIGSKLGKIPSLTHAEQPAAGLSKAAEERAIKDLSGRTGETDSDDEEMLVVLDRRSTPSP